MEDVLRTIGYERWSSSFYAPVGATPLSTQGGQIAPSLAFLEACRPLATLPSSDLLGGPASSPSHSRSCSGGIFALDSPLLACYLLIADVHKTVVNYNIDEVCQRFSVLYTGAISDVLDEMGYASA